MKFNPKSVVLGLLFGFISFFTVFAADTAVLASAVDTAIKVEIDGTQVTFSDQQPIIIDGRTLVPVRGVFEQLGYTVNWNGDTRTAILTNGVYSVYITQDKSDFTTNGQTFYLDVPAQNINGRIMLPLRAVLESVGYGIDWNGSMRTVIITTNSVIVETHYAEFPTVLNFGAYIKITSDKVLKTYENDITVFTYSVTVNGDIVRNYANELIKLGFVQNVSQTKVGYTVYILGDITVSINVSVNGKVIIKIWRTSTNTTVIVNLSDYPDIPDIGGFVSPQIKVDKTTDEYDGKIYWYKGITEVTIQTYISELLKLGFVVDNVNSKSGYYVYAKGYLSIVIDTTTYKSSRYTLIIIKTVYFANYSGVPVFPSSPERTTIADSGNGTIYWYLDVKEVTVQDYIKYLIKLEFTNDTTRTKNGYYVYIKGDTSVIIDTISQRGYVLVTISVTANITYFKEFPTVPMPNAEFYKSERVQYGAGYIYWYTILEKTVIEHYISLLRSQGYTINKDADYYYCVKGNITVTVDAVSVTVDTLDGTNKYYMDFPTVPDFAVVVKDYWTVPTAYITLDGNTYKYAIKTTGGWFVSAEAARQAEEQRKLNGDYVGNVDLYELYINTLLKEDFVEVSDNTDVIGIIRGTTRYFVKNSIRVSVYTGPGIAYFKSDVAETTYIWITISRN